MKLRKKASKEQNVFYNERRSFDHYRHIHKARWTWKMDPKVPPMSQTDSYRVKGKYHSLAKEEDRKKFYNSP
jgi:hypothetical protein